jgi:hypothetical protein
MSERGKSNSISRSRTHTNRSTAEKQTSKNKNRSEFDQCISDTESRERNEEKCRRRYLMCVWEEKERQRDGECVAAAESTSKTTKSHKTQSLYERKETQHGAIKRERERSTWTYLPHSLLIYLPSYLVTYLFPYWLTYPLFLTMKVKQFSSLLGSFGCFTFRFYILSGSTQIPGYRAY